MKSFLFTIWVLTLLQVAKSFPCIGDSCETLSQLYSEYDSDDGVFYIREGSHNSASSNNNDEDPEKELTSGFNLGASSKVQQNQQEHHTYRQQLSKNYHQNLGQNTPGLWSYQSTQQPYNQFQDSTKQYRSNSGRNYKSRNQGIEGGKYSNNGVGYNRHIPDRYPGSDNQGGNGEDYQNNDDDDYRGRYPGSGNQGGGGGSYHQNNGIKINYERYSDRQSSCPNCYATDFGNGNYNKNIINIEK